MLRLLLMPVSFVLALVLAPGELRLQSEPISFLEQLADDFDARDAPRHAPAEASGRIQAAVDAGVAYLALPRDAGVLDDAARAGMRFDPAAARRLAERVLEVEQPAALAARAHDIAGYAAAALGDDAGAVAHLTARTPSAGEDPIAPFRALWLARAALASSRPELALDAAREAAAGLPRHIDHHEAITLAARARLQIADERSAAVAEMDRLLEIYPEYPHRDTVQLEIADAELALGRWQAAASRLDRWVWERPFHPLAERATAALDVALAHGANRRTRTMAERLEHGSHLRYLRQWDSAERVLRDLHDEIVESGRTGPTLAATRFELALNAYDSARFADALTWLDRLESDGVGDVSAFERARWRARTLSRLGRADEGWEVFAAYYAERSPSSRARSLREFADDLGRWSDSVSLRGAYFSDGDWRTFDGAFAQYLSGNYERADDLFASLASRSSGTNRVRYLYWLGRTRLRAGDVDGAMSTWAVAAAERPDNYYGLQAANRMLEVERGADGEPLRRPARIHWDGIDAEPNASLSAIERAHREDIFEPWADAAAVDGGVRALAQHWGAEFPAARTAAGLVDVGAAEDARITLRDAGIEYRTLAILFGRGREVSVRRPIRLTQELWAHEIDNRSRERGWWGIEHDGPRYPVPTGSNALDAFVARHRAIRDGGAALRQDWYAALREVGDHYLVRRMAYDDGAFYDQPVDGPERVAWQDAYPHAYGRLVEPWARTYDLNPFMFWSLVIVESDMNPDSVSHADAYGLLQVIPRTGELVALHTGAGDFGIHDLLHPSDAIRYGSWYLAQLIRTFQGQELLAFVAYNAGPHQVARWLDWRGDRLDLDEFIETVPFDGARRYPQRIMQYLSTYRGIYYGDRSVYVGNELDPAWLEGVYF